METQVIAVSGASGAGKTMLVKQLAEHFNCPALFFDDFVDDRTYPKDMQAWFKQGADVSLIETPQFTAALAELKASTNSRFVFIEEPFGRERMAMKPLINKVVLLETPLEICLCRVIQRHTVNAKANAIENIASYLDKYQGYFRNIYSHAVGQVKVNADLVHSGEGDIEQVTTEVAQWLLALE